MPAKKKHDEKKVYDVKTDKVESPVDQKAFFETLSKELHKPVQKKFPTRQVFAAGKDDTWSFDIADMGTWQAENDGIKYIFTLVDVFTRWAAARSMKTKSADEVLDAFKSIVKERGTTPKNSWCDFGGEFENKKMTAYNKEHKINMYHTYGPGKSVIVERFNKTLKGTMWRKLTALNSHKWVAILPQLMRDYNSKVHSTLGMTPDYASKHPEKAKKVWDAKLNDQPLVMDSKYKVGDKVRISRVKGVFEKGFDAGWSQEIYTVSEVIKKYPVTYVLTDWNGEEIQGSFYDKELQKTALKDEYAIEKILEYKTIRGKKMMLVKWLGYSDKFNTWEPVN